MNRQKSFETQQATLYLVPTPIGNLSEMTKRALETLENVDIIACEDTRNTSKLLMAYNIKKPLISHHEHNQKESIPRILHELNEGKSVAVVSDAGYPLVSDPGQKLVCDVIEQGNPVVSLSGCNAAMNALVASGLSTQHYLFYGFLDSKSSKRKKQLNELKTFPYTIIFYEAPHRISSCLEDILEVFGNRNMCLARELTKLHEEFIRGTVEEVLSICDSLKGEMVLVIEGNTLKEEVDMNDAIDKVNEYVQEGYKTKQAIQLVAKELNIKKNELYDLYHKQES
ncbi:MAG: 16S rRNA (cytidine(1402)-2'-O)-methyltransferase [Erysipelotrichaceae bacterium]|uniref:16S rRNA (cytidine(1402)-2'-O)-methyltransferase n=1 Tax=Floccifex sp. TaxID=2815810 RepID=UPI002A751CBF|nr:16S rRNA (cytidine(1402)-2'-O)-methyltransferase [Floccifex sp.]MDD7282229.1 16S rRNA (cytidine(1402)-2'-O)-methyltransferase [Erysipelotrichaceae bacterium]MDY2957754.1 16S rRNA (cytidine(1402)-2'-O)-methyltransferase [Floccifex sp.]